MGGPAGALAPRLARRLGALAAAGGRGLSTTAGAAQLAHEESWPVVIAGGGPTGLTAALLLHKYGVRSVVLERAAALTDHPQAHFINMRAMEVFRTAGGAQGGLPRSTSVRGTGRWSRARCGKPCVSGENGGRRKSTPSRFSTCGAGCRP